jgi:hypothetical protein
MIDIASECRRLLANADIASMTIDGSKGRALAFEGTTVLGFILIYPDAGALREHWRSESQSLITTHQLSLRRAQVKAWNTYVVLLAAAAPTYADQVAISAIEEDLVGTRKLAAAGVQDSDALRTALLPLLPIQSAPRLEAVDMRAEIQLRTTELPPRAVEAFLSEASVAVVAQALET